MNKHMLEPSGDGTRKTNQPTPPADVIGGGDGSFRGFNRTGREDTTDEIIRPKLDSRTKLRNSLLIAAVLALLAVVGYMAYSRSGLTFSQPAETNKAFAPQPQPGE